MPFKRAVQRYGHTPPADTPFARAGQIWDDRIGSVRVQARHWRSIAWSSLALSGVLGGGLVWLAQQSRIVPYIVTVDHLGAPSLVGPVGQQAQPDEAQLAWFLGHFVEDVRSVTLDPVLMRRNWLEAYGFVTARGARFLDAQARADDPFANVGERTVSVQVTSVVRVSARSFQVKWAEQRFERGNPVSASHWTAILTIVVQPPRSADVLRRNPLGLYVDALDWSRELETPSVMPPPVPVAPAMGETVSASSPRSRSEP
jgi:type IV secretory pathway TrbF-like protein